MTVESEVPLNLQERTGGRSACGDPCLESGRLGQRAWDPHTRDPHPLRLREAEAWCVEFAEKSGRKVEKCLWTQLRGAVGSQVGRLAGRRG